MTEKVLYLVVNCCVEQSRYEIMKQVVQSIKDEQRNKSIDVEKDMIVFDNGSSYSGSIELLQQFDCPIVASNKNLGYWSAINWVLNNLSTVRDDHERFEYVYIIESDHIHFALEKIKSCESVLDRHAHIGSVRVQEYSVDEKHLYDKTVQHVDSKKYAWVSHINAVTKETVKLDPLDPELDVYESNFLTCLHSVNRRSTLSDVFKKLSTLQKFSELDFQKLYHQTYPRTGQLNGGVFHAKLGFTPQNPDVLSGSWSRNISKLGYVETRRDSIRQYAPEEVSRIR